MASRRNKRPKPLINNDFWLVALSKCSATTTVKVTVILKDKPRSDFGEMFLMMKIFMHDFKLENLVHHSQLDLVLVL